MNLIRPTLSVRTLVSDDAAALTRLIREPVGAAPYSSQMDEAVVVEEILAPDPPTRFSIRLMNRLHLGVWRAGAMVGFLDAAVGLDNDSLDLPEYQPLGLVRFLALSPERELANEVSLALWPLLQAFWQKNGVGYVKAFHISTGYPSFQAGAGILPGDWAEHVRVLTADGFHLVERYYCLYRVLDRMIEEVAPLADLSLVYRGDKLDRTYQIFYRRTEFVGSARIVSVSIRGEQALRIAYLTYLHIRSQWRRQNIGRWFLRRMLNDATLQAFDQMVLHLAHGQHAAMNLFVQHGFQELNYRGYTLDKVLTD